MFCACEHCQYAREHGGRNLRRRTSALIDGELLIDVGPDLNAASQALRLDLSKVRWVLQTHSHSDHLLDSNFMCRESEFTATEPAWWDMYGSAKSLLPVAEQGHFALRKTTLHAVAPFETFQVGPYLVTSFLARHDMSIDPLFYAIQRDGKTLLWGNDTGPFFPETWAALERLASTGVYFQAACIEATMGNREFAPDAQPGHMSLQLCIAHHNGLRARGLLRADSQSFAHHFSHHESPPHDVLEQQMSGVGVRPAYDGLEITL